MGRLDDLAAELPAEPGVYLFKDRRGRVLYVGKAIHLRNRVRQYLSGQDERFMVPFLVSAAADLETIVTSNEKEALLLENTLIKKHRPRFNVKLRDDATYMHLRLDLREAWPRYRVVRRVHNDGARYFGPYASAQKARDTLEFLQRVFPLRTCSDATLRTRTRPCMLHQIGRCVAPCVELVTRADYLKLAHRSTGLLEGKVRGVIDDLRDRMVEAAEQEAFEEAARLRDRIKAIEATVERQHVVDVRRADRDVWGLMRAGSTVAVALLPVREGALSEPLVQVLRGAGADDAELLSSLLNTTYGEEAPPPPEVLVPIELPDAEPLAAVLSERAGRKVRVLHPERGDKTHLLRLAADNARVHLERRTDEAARREQALATLAKLVGLKQPPHRIECFDNSHLRGADPVAAMAVFLDGQPARDAYRRYRVKEAPGDDDYAAMHEILSRRVRRGIDEDALPDLLVIDGGKGQLGVVSAVLRDLGVPDQPVIGIAKPRTEHRRGERDASDKIILPGVKDPIRLAPHDPALRLLQHLRDETHRHAVGYQRKVRQKHALLSALEAIPGVGPARRRALLTALGSIEAVIAADVGALAEVPGIGPSVAAKIHAALRAG